MHGEEWFKISHIKLMKFIIMCKKYRWKEQETQRLPNIQYKLKFGGKIHLMAIHCKTKSRFSGIWTKKNIFAGL